MIQKTFEKRTPHTDCPRITSTNTPEVALAGGLVLVVGPESQKILFSSQVILAA